MNLTSMVEQPETINPGADRYEYPRRFNLLDMFGLSRALSPVTPQPEIGHPEENSYDRPMFDWEVVGKCESSRSKPDSPDFGA